MIAVMTLINLLDKPALKYWANKQGLKGVDINKYEKKVQKEGTNSHNEIEEYIKNGTLFDGHEFFSESVKGFKILGCEVDLDNGYICGRADLVLSRNNKIYVVDFKRNRNIYLSTRLQLSAYKHILNADYICYMNLDDYKLNIINIDTSKYFNIIKSLYKIKIILNELNERL